MPPRKRVTPVPDPAGPASDSDFTYRFPDGQQVTVPSLSIAPKPPFDDFTAIQTMADPMARQMIMTRMLVEYASGPVAWDVIRVHPIDKVGEFIAAWSEHSGVELGE